MNSSPINPKSTYHHGKLPERLMELAVASIAASGTEALSLRALAREAGVSATAPYRHFPSKRCLLAGIATRGFNELSETIAQQLATRDNIEDRFIAMGQGYIDFAVRNPVPYQLMFGSVLADFSDYAMLQNAAEDSYAQLLDELSKLIKARKLSLTTVELGGVVWSGVHGMASLMINHNNKARPETHSRPGPPTNNLPTQSIANLHQNTEKALRTLFGHFIADH